MGLGEWSLCVEEKEEKRGGVFVFWFPIFVANLAVSKSHGPQIYCPLFIHWSNHWSIVVYNLSCFEHFLYSFNTALVQLSSKSPNDINIRILDYCKRLYITSKKDFPVKIAKMGKRKLCEAVRHLMKWNWFPRLYRTDPEVTVCHLN